MHGEQVVEGRIESTMHFVNRTSSNPVCSFQDCLSAEDSKQLHRSGTGGARSSGGAEITIRKGPPV
jgi:hypothetical protein